MDTNDNYKVCKYEGDDSWVVLSDENSNIKKKVESKGKPLKEWNIRINYGIKTGFDKAFWVNSTIREEILQKCISEDERIRTAEIIRPLLRGKDITKYGYRWADKWLISTFPSKKYNIDDSRIITHCMATGKLCPQPFVWPPKIGENGLENIIVFLSKESFYNKYPIYEIIFEICFYVKYESYP